MADNNIVIVSKLADELIKESLPDYEVLLFTSVNEILQYTDRTPIRAQRLYITREAVVDGGVRNTMGILLDLFSNIMCQVEEVIYVTEENSEELPAIDYILKEGKIANWTVRKGYLTREYVASIVCGESTDVDEGNKIHRRGVYKVKRSEYVQEKLNHSEVLDDKYESEEEKLANIPDIPILTTSSIQTRHNCKIINNAGLPCKERTIFSFLLAQYCSHTGKTLIIESDFDFLLLSDMVARAIDIQIFEIDIDDFYDDYNNVFEAIKTSPNKLIALTARNKKDYNYDFIFNIMYAQLSDQIDFIIHEVDINKMIPEFRYNIVMPNNTVDVIKTLHAIPTSYNLECRFVGVDISSIEALAIKDKKEFSILIQSILDINSDIEVSLLKTTSVEIGGETHDLCLYTN